MMILSIWLQVVFSCVISSVAAGAHHRYEVPQIVYCSFEHSTGEKFLRLGTLISPEYIVLNSNNIYGHNVTKILCILGAYNVLQNEPGRVSGFIPPENIIFPEKYLGPNSNDIALIKLPLPVALTEFIQPASLPNKEHIDENLAGAMITGISQNKKGYPTVRSLIIAKDSICRKFYSSYGRANFCSLAKKGYTSEMYFIKHGNQSRVLVGLSLYSAPLKDVRHTMIRMSCRIDYYLDWIYKATNIPQTP